MFAENLNPERIARVFQAEVAMHVKYGNLEAFGALRILAREISVLCAADNPAFNWVDFMRGCGFDDLEPTGTEVTLEDRLDRFPD